MKNNLSRHFTIWTSPILISCSPIDTTFFYKIFIAQKVSNIHLVTKDFKIVPLTNLLKLFLAGRVTGGGSVLLGLY